MDEKKCHTCRRILPLSEFTIKYNEEYTKNCSQCNEKARKRVKKCEHGRRKSRCKDCGGTAICKHNVIKIKCKKCGGSQICEHNIVKSTCLKCKGGSICEHNCRRSRCTKCQGGSICKHGRRRSDCKDCGGGSICDHDHLRSTCKGCKGGSICEHGNVKYRCKKCKGGSFCSHNKEKSRCKICQGSQICEHNIDKRYCKNCGGSSLCKSEWCDTRSNPKYDGYCTFCFQNIFPDDYRTPLIRKKSKEIQVRNFINETYENFIHDQPFYTGHCDCTQRRRIDHYTIIKNTCLAIETDENQHRGYDQTDEEARYNDLYMGFSGKFIYIRFNPDKYKDENGKVRNPKMTTRLAKLEKEIDKQVHRIKKGLNKDLVEIVHLYYNQ